MQEEQKLEPQEEVAEDKPVEPQREQMPTFAIGNVSVVVTE